MAGRGRGSGQAWGQAWWLRQWFGPRNGLTLLLQSLARLYRVLQRRDRARRERLARQQPQPDCAVVVVGNLVVGGAGKTPVTIALVQALQAAGQRPGVVSRGYGRRSRQPLAVSVDADAADVGDEPLLIHRRTGAPVQVGEDRADAARRLLARAPQLDVIVADDGLQHRQLRRDVEVIVFDERGVGNGLLLPAGPLREPFEPQPPAAALVVYNAAAPSTAWPGHLAQRRLQAAACPLPDWLAGRHDRAQPLSSLRGQPLLALAGIAVPQRFFAMLQAEGLSIEPLARPDHDAYEQPPWTPGTPAVITTEKDAVKLARWAGGATRVWVLGLDLALPAAFTAALLQRLPAPVPAPRP
ncbi:MAG: tetraacyldisaccharide 4'-kinase [Rubrivivax sp.]